MQVMRKPRDNPGQREERNMRFAVDMVSVLDDGSGEDRSLRFDEGC